MTTHRDSGRDESRPLLADGGRGEHAGEGPDTDSGCGVRVENLGGIERLELGLDPGVTVLSGENATNRSSLLRAVAAGLGGNRSAGRLKTDADSGEIGLSVGGRTHTRTFERTNGGVETGGDPYCEAAGLVDVYVTFFADNPIRRAVANEDGLRDLLMEPVNTATIRERIESLQAEQRSLETDIERIRERERRLPELEERRQQLTGDIEQLIAEIEEQETVIDGFETGETPQAESKAATLREEVTGLRERLRDIESEIETATQRVDYRESEHEAAIEEREAVAEELAALDSDGAAAELDGLSRELDSLEASRQDLQTAIEDLQSVVRVNERLLDGDLDTPGLEVDSVASALDPDSQSVECWTCGTETDRGSIADRVGTLRDVVASQREELREVEARIEELEEEKRALNRERERRRELETRLSDLEERAQRHEQRAAELRERRDELRAQADDIEAEIADREAAIADLEPTGEADEREAVVAAHQELTRLERERGRLESQLADVTDTIEGIEAERERREEYESTLAEVETELERQRGRIDDLETELTETMNGMMADLLDVLGYDNLARVWLERRTDGESTFVLHVVREREDGAVYEDTVETLSESEREVISLVVTLAGYVVHDVAEQAPFLLLDSVEMIDGERMADVLAYVVEHTAVEFLLVALLEKDARAIEEAGLDAPYSVVESTAFGG
jgi:DNA repair exonuclease SbcCD ATPase subunit